MNNWIKNPSQTQIKSSITQKQCSICLNQIQIQSAASLIPCLHPYCIHCILRWSNVKPKCPLCNSNFTSWLVRMSRRRTRTSVLPTTRRRSFGLRGVSEEPGVVADRVKQWRASIYEERQQAVPSQTKNSLMQQLARRNNGAKEQLIRRIEPWIRRELEAVLRDPDPTVIVHVVTSLFILLHENILEEGSQADVLAPLRNFLHEHTDLFWHELRCYAESSLSMETYDTFVVYRRMGVEDDITLDLGATY